MTSRVCVDSGDVLIRKVIPGENDLGQGDTCFVRERGNLPSLHMDHAIIIIPLMETKGNCMRCSFFWTLDMKVLPIYGIH